MSKRLLIVDDEEMIRISLADFFDDMGWEVHAFETGEEALAFLTSNTVDFASVDLRLPGMNGAEFIRQAHTLHPDIRFIIYTGSINYALPIDLIQIGLTEEHVLFKPVNDLMILHNILLSL